MAKAELSPRLLSLSLSIDFRRAEVFRCPRGVETRPSVRGRNHSGVGTRRSYGPRPHGPRSRQRVRRLRSAGVGPSTYPTGARSHRPVRSWDVPDRPRSCRRRRSGHPSCNSKPTINKLPN